MARINVEEKALTDPRFYRLGNELGADPDCAHAVGLFAMIRIWKECIERGAYILEGWIIQAALQKTNAPDFVVSADLAVRLSHNRFRIRGTRGRVEYLEESRKRARDNGQKGGRPRKPTSVSTETTVGLQNKTPPAPAPAPAPAQLLPEDTAARVRARRVNPTASPQTPEEIEARDRAFELWTEVHGVKPSWRKPEYTMLWKAIERCGSPADFLDAWRRFLLETIPFYQTHDPKKFFSDLDKWRSRPLKVLQGGVRACLNCGQPHDVDPVGPDGYCRGCRRIHGGKAGA